MNRIELVQALIDKKEYDTYLEIGVEKGFSFFPIVCKNKIAVDPNFKIPFYRKMKWDFKNPTNKNNQFYEKTSDDFFKTDAPSLFDNKNLDLSFIDGLHTFEAALNDVLNSLQYLAKSGMIVMHDCLPNSRAAETPAKSYEDAMAIKPEGWQGFWTGDVWKVITYLRRKYKDELESFVFDSDFGLGIVIPKSQEIDLEIDNNSFNEIQNYNYDYLIRDPENLIGLKPKTKMSNFVKSL